MAESSDTNGESQDAPQGAEQSAEQVEAPTLEDLQAKVEELTKHSRKWEERAKSNFEKVKELDELKRSQLSDDERRSADLAAAQERAQEAEARAEQAANDALRFRLAAQHGISDEDAELYLSGCDEETMTQRAAGLAARATPPGNRPNPAQGRRGAEAVTGSVDEQGAAALSALFNS